MIDEKVLIREVESEDYSKLNRLYMQVDELHSIAHPNVFKGPISNVRTLEYIKKIIEDPNHMLFVATFNNEIIGLAKAEIETASDFPLFVPRRWMLIGTIIVDKEHRGMGVGKMLLSQLSNWAKSNQVYEVELTVYTFNEAARKFYEKNGFSVIKQKMFKEII